MAVPAAGSVVTPDAAARRPTDALPLPQLLNLSIYWLGINAIWAGLHDVVLPRRLSDLVPEAPGTALGVITAVGMVVAILVQPTAGAISDYTVTRWGRRKPFIVVGGVLDVVFLVAIATSQTYLALLAFVALLQFSSNLAQGPFQGYVPDLVPARQVGLASGLMGVMIVLGQMVGVGLATLALVRTPPEFLWPTVGLGLVELSTALVLVAFVREGRDAPPRAGRSWAAIAASTWGTDILRERSYVFMLFSRLFFLAVPAVVTGFALYFLQRSLGFDDEETGRWLFIILAVVGVTTAITTYPAARLSDRFGRKPVIYGACAVGAAGTLALSIAPSAEVAVAALIPFGVAVGAFLAVDWALMTDIIPKATAGRYMGISNVATALSGPLGLLVGGVVLDVVSRTDWGGGPRAAFALTLGFFALAALFLRPVDASRRED